MLKDQNKQFDQLAGIAHNMKEDGRMIGEEIDYQNNMMDNLNKGMDKTNMKMMRVDSKLKRLIAESNQWWLWCIIILEIVALVCLIIFL